MILTVIRELHPVFPVSAGINRMGIARAEYLKCVPRECGDKPEYKDSIQ
ncbi:protein of unknown function [Xenorhabdus doucetiae]|uniref:Uncharacterized protein n=1 Tax=Xenorhabdus doucetiae TaxID=351671 RepID=A0A068QNK1_9GAMM|nr:protein of unknown function [Xenorhabdus doucetiae]